MLAISDSNSRKITKILVINNKKITKIRGFAAYKNVQKKINQNKGNWSLQEPAPKNVQVLIGDPCNNNNK